jgi:2-dehydro-3-deoxyphosphogluconate aldolase / (4S)-4-hydroxy-2-oxoglutarate aldolase
MLQPLLISSLKNNGLLPLFKSNDVYLWQNLIDICYEAGIRVMEFRDSRETRGLKIFPHLIAHCRQFDQIFYMGVNTVRDASHCAHFLETGAAYISSPLINHAVATVCHHHNGLWIPGCNGLQDINLSITLGADIVSILPGAPECENPETIHQAFPVVQFIPSCGLQLNELDCLRWLKAGALCVRSESKIFPEVLTSIRDWSGIKRLIWKELHGIKTTRQEIPRLSYSIL